MGRAGAVRREVGSVTLVRAWRLLDADPVPEVRGLYPDVEVDEGRAAGWHRSLAGAWRKHAETD